MTMNRTYWGLVVFTVLLAGCIKNNYDLTLTPTGDQMQRELTCWRDDNNKLMNFPDDELKRICEAYRRPVPAVEPKKYTFSGSFTEKMPADLGGAGWYLHFSSEMGRTFGYMERFRGNDNLNASLAEMHQAGDKLVDLLLGWLRTELGRDPNFDKLENFCNGDFRRDIKNLSVYSWVGQSVAQYNDQAAPEMYLRGFQYLTERGYFNPKDTPALVTVFGSGANDNFLLLTQKLVAQKMGYDPNKKLPGSLAFLEDTDRAKESFEKYLSGTPEYQKLLTDWERQKKTQKDAPKPDPETVMENLLVKAAGLESTDPGVLKAKLVCATQPFDTNGQWDKEKKAVTWTKQIEPRKALLPTFLYAAWSLPDEPFQKEHFGKIVLDNQKLAEYCLWRKNLKENQAAEWDAFILSLRPDKNLPEKLNAFHFSDEPKPNPGAPKPAGSAATWINHFLAALQPTKTQSAQPIK
jgi:hypothetical protein